MEEAEQRKKRPKEMWMQADLAEASGGIDSSRSMLNPLIEASSTMPPPDKSHAAPRFDFYTDPMSAFFTNKRSNANIQVSQCCFTPPKFGGSPMAKFSSPRQESINPQMTPSPHRNPVWNGSRGPSHYKFPSRPSSGGSYPRPGFEPPGGPLFNSVQGITHRPSHSPNPSPGYRNSPSPGRVRGCWYNTKSPGSGRGGRQGMSSHGRCSNEDKPFDPTWFYKGSMVEDPWQVLKPVTWKVTDASLNTLYTPESSKSGTSESLSTKGGGSSAASVKSSSQPSLAEYLAAALNEAINDAETV